MINYFPTPYPDELIYSLLARCYVKSGYLTYTYAAQDFFLNKNTRPNIEFINEYTPEMFSVLTKNIPMEDIIIKHIMFPYYARFISKDRRIKAFQSLLQMNDDYYKYIRIPKSKTKTVRTLRYCPICATKDREEYGETYWHRIHQLVGVDICPRHHCQLISSGIPINSKTSPSLITAEETIPLNITSIQSNNELECRLAEYISQVFLSDINIRSDITVGDFLHSKMEYTKYLSLRGEQRNMTLFHSDFINYYQLLPNNQFKESWQLQKVFTNDRYNTYEICMMAMFLNISVNELINMKLPEKSQQQLFDEKIKELHNQGLNYRQISNQLNSSYDLVKAIGEGRYSTYHYSSPKPQKGGAKKMNWDKIDTETLPIVKQTIKQLQSNKTSKPKKITVSLMLNLLNLPNKRFDKCPKCKAEINKHIISQEEHWAKLVVWAADKSIKEGRELNYSTIIRLTNMRRQNLKDCLPYLHLYTNNDLVQTIYKLI